MKENRKGLKLPLGVYDFLIFLIADTILYVFYKGAGELSVKGIFIQSVIAFITIFGARIICKIYRQIWRFAGTPAYIRLLEADTLGGIAFFLIGLLLPFPRLSLVRKLAVISSNLLTLLVSLFMGFIIPKYLSVDDYAYFHIYQFHQSLLQLFLM